MRFLSAKKALFCCCSLAILTGCQFTEFADYASVYNMDAHYTENKGSSEFLRITGLVSTDQRGAGKIVTKQIGKRLNVYIKLVPGGDFKIDRLIMLPSDVDEVYLGDSTNLLWLRSIEEKNKLKNKVDQKL